MGAVVYLFSEDIAGVDDARDMSNLDSVFVVSFTYLICAEVEVLDTFGGYRSRPLDASLVFVVDNSAVGGIVHAKVSGM